ncbi:ADP-ribosylglycohydrolase family protein [Myxococcota bacterium]|nr:ADP-ribosylglycohydrolase family protein [Myxococcota bacterium]MBU1899577.1 ADP-ribosylglycohydrolase family protein [Myxococcota bacterium]
MLGAIAGDIIGQPWEGWRRIWQPADRALPLFEARAHITDDTVLTLAVARHLLGDTPDLETAIRESYRRYPRAGYGGMFRAWCEGRLEGEYRSYGNGSAMRVSPVAWAFESLEAVMEGARQSALPTHAHPEGIKGAQAIAGAIFLARTGHGKREIAELARALGYQLEVDLSRIQSQEWFATCQATVPAALVAFLEEPDFDSMMRRCLSYNGDSDTIAAMAGPISEAMSGGLNEQHVIEVKQRLDPWLFDITQRFIEKFLNSKGMYPNFGEIN